MKLLSILMLLASMNVNAETAYNYKIIKVIDGDTVNIKVDFLIPELGDSISMRIFGIDAPEMHGRCIKEIEQAKAAKVFLSNLVKDKQYSIVIKGRDKFFRVIGDIKIDGRYVSDILVEKGYARRYNGHVHKQLWCDTI